ncbi:PP2C family protein-serine/threonine phosphatase [Streptomyces sp. NPDC086787]|uniref:PP2C family protein-serine/threonine phosphatase n=1 Tax=Streptomyces sp. NPDC086787 TaxID=3365759 RepID=UPI003804D254
MAGHAHPARAAVWMYWLPYLYVTAVLLLEPVTPVEWPLSFVLMALPLVTAFAYGPVGVAVATVAAILLEMSLAGTRCCANRTVEFLWVRHYVAAYICTALVGTLGAILAAHRIRRDRALADVRYVAEIAQRVLLRQVPHRIGNLLLDSLYLSAAAEARIGGDLYEAVPTPYGVRLVVGDVRGKGLVAVESAAGFLEAFREAALDEPDLPTLADRLEKSVNRRGAQLGGIENGEGFVTAVFAEIPAEGGFVRIVNCGHPPPFQIRPGEVRELDQGEPSLPLNLGMFAERPCQVAEHPFEAGDLLLFYTDGITETRDGAGRFYPLAERLRSWRAVPPQTLLDHLHDDLLAYSRNRPQDDIAALTARLR